MLDQLAPVIAMGELRVVEQRYNPGLVAVSIALSLLGAFTSTQL